MKCENPLVAKKIGDALGWLSACPHGHDTRLPKNKVVGSIYSGLPRYAAVDRFVNWEENKCLKS